MNSAYELALKEIGSAAWLDAKDRSAFVDAMLGRAGIATAVARNFAGWGHQMTLEQARPGDIAIVSVGAAGDVLSEIPVFFVRRTGAFIEGLTLTPDLMEVKIQRFHTRRIHDIRRPPKRVEQEPLAPPAAQFVNPGAASKPVLLRKADPTQDRAPEQAFVPPPAPRYGLKAIAAAVTAIAALLWAAFGGF